MRLPYCLVALLSMAVGCSEQAPSPTAPLSPTVAPLAAPASYAGAWQVTYRHEECISRHCYSLLGQEAQVDLRLTQSGSRVSGVVSGAFGYTDVSGTVAPDGRLALSGRSTPGGYSAPGLVADRLELERDPATGLRGYVRLLSAYDGETSAYNGGSGATRPRVIEPPLSDTFAGTWQGYYDLASCAPEPTCVMERKGEFELVLGQRGAEVSGTLSVRLQPAIVVSGTAEGTRAELAGGSADVAVSNLRLQRDQTGRLTGTLTLRSRGVAMTLTLVRVGRLNDEL
jgi:hypothetical protein